jgi:hypothetical protein
MRKLITTATLVAALAGAGSAQAWKVLHVGPSAHSANCHTISCLNGKLNSLTQKLNRDDRALGTLLSCLKEVPLSTYGNPAGTFGYMFDKGSGVAPIDTTAVDVTNPGDTVNGWVLFDGCNSTTTAFHTAGILGSAIAPEANLSPFWQPQQHR